MSADGGHERENARARRDLNALLGSRICHDLISPIGAISNGVELLAMSGISAAPEIALISESVENANARIRFFRIAFGAARPGHAVALSEIQEILADLGRGSRLRIRWEPSDDLDRQRVKLAFLLFMCFESAMPYGGDVVLRGGTAGWQVAGGAERMKIDPTLWALLVDPAEPGDVDPADVHFALVAAAAQDAGATLHTELRDTGIRVSF